MKVSGPCPAGNHGVLSSNCSALRLYPIVQGTSRVAIDDAILPKGGGTDGKSPVFVRAGTLVVFHFVALHKRKDLWGRDADDFRPERWEKEKASWVSDQYTHRVKNNLTIIQNFLPFGGGPRNCIGRTDVSLLPLSM